MNIETKLVLAEKLKSIRDRLDQDIDLREYDLNQQLYLGKYLEELDELIQLLKENVTPMTKQMIITDYKRTAFEETVASYLKDGWLVVPTTLVCLASHKENSDFGQYFVILERN